MAGFGFGSFVKPRPVSVGTADVPKLGDLSMQEKLLMLGAALQGDTQGAMSVPMLAAARRRQADETAFRSRFAEQMRGVPMKREKALLNEDGARIDAAFAPQFETVPGKPASFREMVPLLAEAYEKGYDVKAPLELLDKTTPEYEWINNQRVDPRDPNSPTFIPELEKGMRLGDDGRAEFVPNFVESKAAAESAVTSAQESAKAGYDMVEVSVGGQKVQLPRAVALPLITKAFAEANGGKLPENFGVSESPAEQAAAVADVENQAAVVKEARAAVAGDEKLSPLLDQMEELLESGDIITGAGADLRLNFDRALALGGNEDAKRRVTATETYQNLTARQVLPLVKQLGSGNGITDADRKFTQAIVAGDIALNEETMREVIAIGRRVMEANKVRLRELEGGRKPKSAAAAKRNTDLSAIPLEERLAEARKRGLIQ